MEEKKTHNNLTKKKISITIILMLDLILFRNYLIANTRLKFFTVPFSF